MQFSVSLELARYKDMLQTSSTGYMLFFIFIWAEIIWPSWIWAATSWNCSSWCRCLRWKRNWNKMPLCSSPNQTTTNLPSYFRQFKTDNWSQYYLYLPTASVRASARLNIDQWYQGSTARSGRYHGGCAYTGYSNKHEGGRKPTCLEKQACTFISLKASSYIQRSKFVSMYNHN